MAGDAAGDAACCEALVAYLRSGGADQARTVSMPHAQMHAARALTCHGDSWLWLPLPAALSRRARTLPGGRTLWGRCFVARFPPRGWTAALRLPTSLPFPRCAAAITRTCLCFRASRFPAVRRTARCVCHLPRGAQAVSRRHGPHSCLGAAGLVGSNHLASGGCGGRGCGHVRPCAVVRAPPLLAGSRCLAELTARRLHALRLMGIQGAEALLEGDAATDPAARLAVEAVVRCQRRCAACSPV